MRIKPRWLVLLGLLGLGLVGCLLWAFGHAAPPPWPVLVADVIAVAGLAVGPWLLLAARQLFRTDAADLTAVGSPAARTVFSRIVVVVVAVAIGGPLAGVVATAVLHPPAEVVAVLGLSSIIAATLIALVGGVILPWLFLLTRTVARERSRRVRAEERAEVAAHLHDSVLQALTLIQKQAEDSRAVRRLARGTERELRAWLYGGPPPAGTDFAGAVRAVAEEIEDRFDVTVELVTVGTAELDSRIRAVVGALREALTNAAKHARVPRVSVLAEAAGGDLLVLVRDRGRGFDRDVDPPADRRGIADSIEARMRQQGGTAVVRSAPGEGTEVELRMPASADTDRAAPVHGHD